jgi:glutathione S-transferase
MYTLFITNKNYSSWSLRPWLLMRQLGIVFEERLIPFDKDAFRSFSPSGKVPCLLDGGTVVWDSLAITEYLAERHGGVWPADAKARAWARSAAAEMHSGFGALRELCTMNVGIRVKLREIPSSLEQDLERMDRLWRSGLDAFGGPWLAGTAFCAVDAFFAPIAFRIQTYGLALSDLAGRYAQRLLDLGPMQEWYRRGLAETWRDDAHEEEARRAGEWTADLRAQPQQVSSSHDSG